MQKSRSYMTYMKNEKFFSQWRHHLQFEKWQVKSIWIRWTEYDLSIKYIKFHVRSFVNCYHLYVIHHFGLVVNEDGSLYEKKPRCLKFTYFFSLYVRVCVCVSNFIASNIEIYNDK